MKNQYARAIACPLCKKDTYTVLFPSSLTKKDFNPEIIKANLKNTLDNYKKHSRIVKCTYCHMVYTNPLENFSLLLKGYEDVVDEEYIKTEQYRKILLHQHLRRVEKYIERGKILDIGCFAGYFLEIAKEQGWKAYGIEPSKWARAIAKKKNLQVIGDDIETIELAKNQYDVITMWDVIEHLPDTSAILKKCHRSLRKKGIIALGTPNIESIVAKITKNNNPYLIRMHILFFSPKTLTRFLEEAGFTVLNVYSYGRTFPIAYILDRITIQNKYYKKIKSFIRSIPFIANFAIHINIGDSFGIIAQKN